MTRQLPLALDHTPSHAREDLAVGTANAEALAWIDAWPRWTMPALVLCGPQGSGKSHLASIWRQRADALVLDLAIAIETIARDARRAFLLEDVDGALASTEAGERALLHAYNLVVQGGGSLLLTARELPRGWPMRLPDLRSRMLALPVAELRTPDDAMIAAVLGKLFADRQLAPDPDVIAFVVARTERSFARLAQIVAALDQAALAAHRELTVPFVRRTLAASGLIE
ncbi:MAG: hypothetical protein JNK67_03360 [Alphaproteobacteria bacterium]|nr:hypothetical protein [Alphaproteobacteria bacterium]